MPRFLARAALLAVVAGCAPLAPPAFPPGAADPAAPATAWLRPTVLPEAAIDAPPEATPTEVHGVTMPGMDHSHHGRGTP
ncbi:hypothetical protein [Azospirillum sp. B4]|uniref:hypothetical protein n=1 Tax=Azospirillum sp. B4 TaxID=95605 RepID=UPI0011DD41D9|nr:hypothetical protein [Azospirillum sp. B4]